MSTRTRACAGIAMASVVAVALAACGSSGKSAAAPTSTGSTSSTSVTASAAGAKAPIKIGVIGTFSGFAAEQSKPDELAVQAWASATNASGGVNGHQVQVYVEDDAASPSQSLVDVKKLVEQDHVVALVGILESGLEGTWASYVDSKKIPVIGGEATGAPWLSDPNFFPTAANPLLGNELTAYTSKLANGGSYGVAFCAEVPACAQVTTLTQSFAGKLGIAFAGGESLSGSATNYTQQCLTLKAKKAGMIFLATAIPTGTRFMQDCASQGYTPIPVVQGGTWLPSLATTAALKGLWVYSPAFSWIGSSPAVTAFNAAMKKYQPSSVVNGAATSGWSAAALLGVAAAHVSDTPTSADIYQGLYGLGPNYTDDGLIPPVTFAAGKVAVQQPCGWYLQLKGGALTMPKGEGQVCISG